VSRKTSHFVTRCNFNMLVPIMLKIWQVTFRLTFLRLGQQPLAVSDDLSSKLPLSNRLNMSFAWLKQTSSPSNHSHREVLPRHSEDWLFSLLMDYCGALYILMMKRFEKPLHCGSICPSSLGLEEIFHFRRLIGTELTMGRIHPRGGLIGSCQDTFLTYRVGQKSKPDNFCNNFVYCHPISIIFGTYTL